MIAALVLAIGTASAASAQETATPHQRALAERLLELSTGSGLEKLVEQQVDIALAGIGELPAAEAAWVRANMRRMMIQMVDTLTSDMVEVYAEIFSEAELEAQIALYESPLGPSIANKALEVGVRQQAVLNEALLAFLEEFAAKYCAEFDCSAAASKARGL